MTASRDDDQSGSAAYRAFRLRNLDPMPPEVATAGRRAFAVPRPTELALLVHDSLLDSDEAPEKHTLRFEHERVHAQLHVSAGVHTTALQGVLDRPGPTRAVLHFRDGQPAMTAAVEGATFEFAPSGHGSVRIALEIEGGPTVWTDWFRI